MLFTAVAAVLMSAATAHADETDGGSGNGTSGGGPCVLYGWNIVASIDEIVWQDAGGTMSSTDHRCGNSAYVNRDSWTSFSWTDSDGRARAVGAAKAPLYQSLWNTGARECVRRTDVLAVWYLQDDGIPGVRSWSNYGVNPNPSNATVPTNLDGSRNLHALRDAIDDTHIPGLDFTPQDDKGTAWWLSHIKQTVPATVWGYYKSTLTDQQIIQMTHTNLKSGLVDVTGRSPVVFCWFANSPMTCSDLLDWKDPSGNAFWIRDRDGDQSPQDLEKCYLHCPTASRAHAGERLPISVVADDNTGRTRQQKLNDYCWPPDTFDKTDHGWTSQIWGWDALRDGGTVGGPGIYGWITTTTDKTPDFPGMVAWDSTASGNPAPTSFEKSSYGHFWDRYCTIEEGCNPGRQAGSCENFLADYNAAQAATPNNKHASVNLGDYHRKALAQGKVIEVREMEVPTAAYCNLKLDEYWIKRCQGTNYYNWDGSLNARRSTNSCGKPFEDNGTGPNVPCTGGTYPGWAPGGCTSGAWRRDGSQADRPYNIQNINNRRMLHFTKAFQLLTNHCNNYDFNTVASGSYRGSNEFNGLIDSGNSDRYFSASAVSAMYDGDAISAGAVRLPWGVEGTSPKTAEAKFFNRVCAFPGKLSSADNNRAASYQVQNDWTFFRDGEWREAENFGYYTPDMAALSEPVVRYGNEAPVGTIVTRDPLGTPPATQFNLRATNCGSSVSNPVFSEGSSNAPALMNFSRQSFQSASVGMVPGCYNRIESRGIWAGKGKMPQVLTVRWRFSPLMDNHSAVSNVGWGLPAGAGSWNRGTVSTNVDGMVWSKNDGSATPVNAALRQAQWSSSGSGSANTLDKGLAYGGRKAADGRWEEKPTLFNPHYSIIAYVRAVAE